MKVETMKKSLYAGISVLGLLAAVSAAPAHAGDMYRRDVGPSLKDGPVMESAVNWSGFYIGAGVGAGAVVHELDVTGGVADLGTGGLNVNGIGGEGVFGTAQAGYDRQLGRFVLGAFFDYDFSGVGTDVSLSGSSELGALSAKAKLDQDYMWTAGGRLGYLVHPETLIYGLAGYSETKFKNPTITLGLGEGAVNHSVKLDTFSGLTVGGGFETRLRGDWFLKGEYRFSQFDKELFKIDDGDGNTARGTLEPDIHTARVVLTYKFDFLRHRSFEPLK
jgi:outer membrane immunogenic protein